MDIDELNKLENLPYVDENKFANEAYLHDLITKLVKIRNIIRGFSQPKV
jgi:hypothetical protein